MASDRRSATGAMWRTPVTDIVRGEATVKDFVETHRPYFSRELVKEPGLAPILDQVAGQIGLRKVVFVVRNPLTNVRSILQSCRLRRRLFCRKLALGLRLAPCLSPWRPSSGVKDATMSRVWEPCGHPVWRPCSGQKREGVEVHVVRSRGREGQTGYGGGHLGRIRPACST